MSEDIIVADLSFGDSGKGGLVDYLVREIGASAVVRYCGGPQSGHHIVLPSGLWFCFSQFGSGTLIPEVKTHLSSQTLVKISNLLVEEKGLRSIGVTDAFDRLTMDPGCHMVMPYHAMIGQMLEISRGQNRFGSVGMGVGQAVLDREQKGKDALVLSDLLDTHTFRTKVRALWREKTSLGLEMIRQTRSREVEKRYQEFIDFVDVEEMIAIPLRFADEHRDCFQTDQSFFAGEKGRLVLEGTQGTLIDRRYGFFPYVTKTSVMAREGDGLLQENGVTVRSTRVGALRAYTTRHGQGPFPTEDEELGQLLPDDHNPETPWNGKVRVGWFDLLMARYGIEVNGNIDYLAMTNLDRLSPLPEIKVCGSYQYLGEETADLDEFFDWEKSGGVIRIVRIKPPISPTDSRQARLAQHLKLCRPLDFKRFESWQKPLNGEALPEGMHRYLDFMESSKGLSVPIGIASIGPTANDKVRRHRFD